MTVQNSERTDRTLEAATSFKKENFFKPSFFKSKLKKGHWWEKGEKTEKEQLKHLLIKTRSQEVRNEEEKEENKSKKHQAEEIEKKTSSKTELSEHKKIEKEIESSKDESNTVKEEAKKVMKTKKELQKELEKIIESNDEKSEAGEEGKKAELSSNDIVKLNELNGFLLKLRLAEKILIALKRTKDKLRFGGDKIFECFRRVAKIHMDNLRMKILKLKRKTDALEQEIFKMKNELSEIKYSNERNVEDKIKDFIEKNCKSEEDKKQLREYVEVLKKTIGVYYKSSGILEGSLSENKKFLDPVESSIEKLDGILSDIPFGKFVSSMIKAAKSAYDHEEERLLVNDFQNFSSFILNSDKLGYILGHSALLLLSHKKQMILNMNHRIDQGFTEMINETHRTLLMKKDKLYQGLDTEAKKMGAIDAAFIIANSYVHFFSKPKTIDCDDIYDPKRTVDFFVECIKLVDSTRYQNLLRGGEIKPEVRIQKHRNGRENE